MNTLFTILAAWSIISSVPYEQGSKTNTMTTCNDTLYVGGNPGKDIQRMLIGKKGTISMLDRSEAFSYKSAYIKEIKVRGDYVYVCTRGNGFGVGVDRKRPVYISPFEGVIGFENTDIAGDVKTDFVEDPCPSRFSKSLQIVKPEGDSHCILSQTVPATENTAEFILWLKVNRKPTGTVTIPLIKDVLAITLDENLNLGLNGNPTRSGDYKYDGQWVNIKLSAVDGTATLSVRGKESRDRWTMVCSSTIGEFKYETVCCGIEGKAAAEIQIDEYAYNPKNIESVSYIDGSLVVLDKKTLKVVTRYALDMRCLSLRIEGNTLYMGMIGGVNIYDLSNPATPSLVGCFRNTCGRSWSYPTRSKSIYSYKVPGQEYQRLDYMELPDGRKILVGGSDVRGITLVDVTDPAAPKLFKNIDTIPTTPIKERSTGQKMYIEWDVRCDYPYIYSTVASLHSLVHNQYYDGAYHPVSWTPDIYGLKVYDISNPDEIRDTIINVSPQYYSTHIAKEGDSTPNQITRIGNKFYLPMSDKGVAVYRIDGFNTKFEGMIEFPEGNRIRSSCAFGDKLVAGGGAVFGPWTECNIFLINTSSPKRRR